MQHFKFSLTKICHPIKSVTKVDKTPLAQTNSSLSIAQMTIIFTLLNLLMLNAEILFN